MPVGRPRKIGAPRGSRTLGPFRRAVLVLCWFRHRTCVHCLVRDAGISQATGYRYLLEGIDVLAERAPDPHQVLDRCRREGMTHLVLDGTLVECDRAADIRENGNNWRFSQKHRAFGGNMQFLSAPDGTPLWVSDVEPGSTPDITAARLHVLPALYAAARAALPTLADAGYTGTGSGVHTPFRPHSDIASPLTAARAHGIVQACLTRQILVLADRAYQGAGATVCTPYYGHRDLPGHYQQYNRDQARLRAPGERAFARLKSWRALQRARCSTRRIGRTVQAVHVLLTCDYTG